jgi:hypothetical protein
MLHPVLMSEPRLADYIDIKIRTLREWRRKRLIPFIRVGRKIQYNVNNVLAALDRFERKAN